MRGETPPVDYEQPSPVYGRASGTVEKWGEVSLKVATRRTRPDRQGRRGLRDRELVS